jgi:GTP-dependent phosphoenolpyruvate carboxykinase
MPEQEPSKFNFSWNRELKDSEIVFGEKGHGKQTDVLKAIIQQTLQEIAAPAQMPLTPIETNIARNELGMSEQEVEKLSRFSGKRWLNALGVEYPKDWE